MLADARRYGAVVYEDGSDALARRERGAATKPFPQMISGLVNAGIEAARSNGI